MTIIIGTTECENGDGKTSTSYRFGRALCDECDRNYQRAVLDYAKRDGVCIHVNAPASGLAIDCPVCLRAA